LLPSAGADFFQASGGGFEELFLKFPRAALRSASPAVQIQNRGQTWLAEPMILRGNVAESGEACLWLGQRDS
jgi:hypothetical protein